MLVLVKAVMDLSISHAVEFGNPINIIIFFSLDSLYEWFVYRDINNPI